MHIQDFDKLRFVNDLIFHAMVFHYEESMFIIMCNQCLRVLRCTRMLLTMGGAVGMGGLLRLDCAARAINTAATIGK